MERIYMSYLIFAMLVLPMVKIDAKVSSIIVFGDSTVDSGNNNEIFTVLKSNFAPYGRDFYGGEATGRFSNGKIPTDFISEAFGLKPIVPAYLDPAYDISDFATGVCFASAGTGYDDFTAKVLSVIPLWKELELYKDFQSRLKSYLGVEKAENILTEALYIISIGTNDYLENYFAFPEKQFRYTVTGFGDHLLSIARQFVTKLYQLGARKISLTGLPPMGCLPLIRTQNVILLGGSCKESYNNVAQEFNEKLHVLIQKLNKELSDIQLVFSNPYSKLYDIIHNPYSYGFEEVSRSCCGTGKFEMSYYCKRLDFLSCYDANKYAFWDSLHPTEKTNRILANDSIVNTLAVFL